MRVAVRKWGNSLALRIPKALADNSHIENGTQVDVAVENGRLIVAPVPAAATLHELLSRVTAENTHAEVDTGGRVGRETW